MPIATLRFKLPDETEEHKTALNGARFWSILFELQNSFLRSKLKYDEEGVHPTKAAIRREAFEEVQAWLIEATKDEGVEI